ncbi:hypothetical protein BU14_0093s0061 [Porphyra umbilicalis]|uniref:RRM Nup35-type domain-containing protein n=1 Tax=Porphyra umbilicalis TaxID=2786 RepID=A0A1X6PDR9_PORUM|nr:hypothetical protein BU14_0093s0061 [Porphyra umbilicalis]|eukprot:OSX79018.1 hypothetical protein BU14_0093s0061 [Porphyra umbilicalis]
MLDTPTPGLVALGTIGGGGVGGGAMAVDAGAGSAAWVDPYAFAGGGGRRDGPAAGGRTPPAMARAFGGAAAAAAAAANGNDDELACWVTAFGFTPAATAAVLRSLRTHGAVTRVVGSVGNWVHARFASAAEASVATWHGLRTVDGCLVGVVPCTEPAAVAALTSEGGGVGAGGGGPPPLAVVRRGACAHASPPPSVAVPAPFLRGPRRRPTGAIDTHTRRSMGLHPWTAAVVPAHPPPRGSRGGQPRPTDPDDGTRAPPSRARSHAAADTRSPQRRATPRHRELGFPSAAGDGVTNSDSGGRPAPPASRR